MYEKQRLIQIKKTKARILELIESIEIEIQTQEFYEEGFTSDNRFFSNSGKIFNRFKSKPSKSNYSDYKKSIISDLESLTGVIDALLWDLNMLDNPSN